MNILLLMQTYIFRINKGGANSLTVNFTVSEKKRMFLILPCTMPKVRGIF